MKIFIAYKFSGEKAEALDKLLAPVCDALTEAGHVAYSTFHDPELQPGTDNYKNFAAHHYVFHAFSKLNDMDLLFVLLTSDEKSEGILLEVGYAMARGIPVVVAVKEDVTKTYLPGVGTATFTWSDTQDLVEKLTMFAFDEVISRRN